MIHVFSTEYNMAASSMNFMFSGDPPFVFLFVLCILFTGK